MGIFFCEHRLSMRPPPKPSETPQTWRERFHALRNVPPLLRMVWRTSPALTIGTLLLRAISAFSFRHPVGFEADYRLGRPRHPPSGYMTARPFGNF